MSHPHLHEALGASSSNGIDPEAVLQRFIDEARAVAAFPGTRWEDVHWKLSPDDPVMSKRAHSAGTCTLYFTTLASSGRHGVNRTPLQEPFRSFLKAVVRRRAAERNQQFGNHQAMVQAGRYLERTLVQATGRANPADLTLRIFRMAEQAIVSSGWSPHHTYDLAMKLQEVAGVVDAFGLARVRIGHRALVRPPPKGDLLSAEGQCRGLAKMPGPETLDALARISHQPADDHERLILRHVDLLVAAGFRIGEALTLPLSCWVEEPDPAVPLSGVKRYGIRYWPEKGGDPIVKWLPQRAVPLARRAITEIAELCAPAREVARWLEAHPGRVRVFTELGDDHLLTHVELKRGLGFGPSTSDLIRLGFEPCGRRGREYLFRVGDVLKALVARRFDRPMLARPGGQSQRLSESLTVCFLGQFRPNHKTWAMLVRPLKRSTVGGALGSMDGFGVFARRGLTAPDGRPIRIRTHAFRHWLNTLADRGGLSDVELARWMGRRDLRQNAAYKHGTVEERAAKARALIAEGRLVGRVADVYQALPPVERDRFLEAAVEAVHVTPFGACVHNFAASPCPIHMACLRGCPDYLRTPGDPQERAALVRLREDTLRSLEMAKAGAAEAFVQHAEALLKGIETALAADDGVTAASGSAEVP